MMTNKALLKQLVLLSLRAAFVLASVSAGFAADSPGWPRGGVTSIDKIQASPLVVDLDGDGLLETIIPSYDDKLYVYSHDGTQRTGWPKSLNSGDGTMSSAAVGDVTGDGIPEIVVATDNSESKLAAIKIFQANGTQLTTKTLSSNSEASGKATPCLVDCKKYSGGTTHPALEIILRDGDGLVHILSWNGSSLDETAGSSLNTCPGGNQFKDRLGFQQITPSVSAVTTATNSTYLVAASTDSKIYRWTINSAASPGNNMEVVALSSLSAQTTTVQFLGSPALYDLDVDGDYEIIAGGSDGKVYVWEGSANGSQFTGNWPRSTEQNILSSPAIAFIDPQSTMPCILAGSSDSHLYAWYSDGTPVSGWPVETNGQIFGSPVAAEIDNSAGLEVLVTSQDGYLNAWEHTGQKLAGWPKRMNTPLFSSPAVADVRGSGRMSVVFGGYNGRVFMFDLARKSLDTNAGWLQFRGNAKRQGHP